MYCSTCGSAVPQNLSFCNRCGTEVSGGKAGGINGQSELSPNALLNAVVAVFVLGLGAIVGLMALMKVGPGIDPIILAAAILSFLLMLVIEGVLVGLLLTGKRRARGAGRAGRPKEQTTRELAEAQARVLPEPVPSVTEHTTRSFEPIYSKRESK